MKSKGKKMENERHHYQMIGRAIENIINHKAKRYDIQCFFHIDITDMVIVRSS